MNFEDEEYVRVYVRNTATTKMLGWEGRTVLWHLLRIVQKTGALELGEGDDLVEIVAALCDLPEDITKRGLERLASRGVTLRHAASLEIVRHSEAQNARRSDRLRAQDYRDRQKAETLDSSEKSGSASRGVTARHDSSLPALPCLALPCLPLPKISEAKVSGVAPAEYPDSGVHPVAAAPGQPRDIQALAAAYLRDEFTGSNGGIGGGVATGWSEVLAVCEAFKRAWGNPVTLRPVGLKDPRLKVILERFSEGFTVGQLEHAIQRSKHAEYIASNQANQTLQTILRDAGQVEKFGALTQAPQRTGRFEQPVSANVEHDSRAALASSRKVREFLEGAK